jgi:hypothetical protein
MYLVLRRAGWKACVIVCLPVFVVDIKGAADPKIKNQKSPIKNRARIVPP